MTTRALLATGAPPQAQKEAGLWGSWGRALLPSPAQEFYLSMVAAPILQVRKTRLRMEPDLPWVTEQSLARLGANINSKCPRAGVESAGEGAQVVEAQVPSTRRAGACVCSSVPVSWPAWSPCSHRVPRSFHSPCRTVRGWAGCKASKRKWGGGGGRHQRGQQGPLWRLRDDLSPGEVVAPQPNCHPEVTSTRLCPEQCHVSPQRPPLLCTRLQAPRGVTPSPQDSRPPKPALTSGGGG